MPINMIEPIDGQKLKILFISSSYHPLTGGAETYAKLLSQGLSNRGHKVTVVTDGSWVPEEFEDESSKNSRVIRLRSFNKRIDTHDNVKWREMQFSVLNELGELVQADEFDLVHANSFETAILASMIAQAISVPLVASLHEQNPDKMHFGKGLCNLVYQHLPVNMFLAASNFYYNRAVRFGVPEDKLRLIYHGVENPNITSANVNTFLQMHKITRGNPTVLLPGRIYQRKAQLDLVDAIPHVLSHFPDAKFIFAGRVSDFDYAGEFYSKIQTQNIERNVSVIEDLDVNDMQYLFRSVDLVVQPSLEEGLGIAVIEAMMAGRPVVATNVDGLKEVISHNIDGLLIPRQDPLALAEAIVTLALDTKLSARLSNAARSTALRRFSIDSMIDATLEAYILVLSS